MKDFWKKLNENYSAKKIPSKYIEMSRNVIEQFEEQPRQGNLKKINFQKIIELISMFLKEEYGMDFYNQFMNNLFCGNRVNLAFGIKKDIDELEYDLKVLDIMYQNKKISAVDYNQRKEKITKRLKLIKESEDINLSHVDPLTGEMLLDIKETIEDAFIILHEGMHRIYTPCLENIDEKVVEAPSLSIEFHLYSYCKRKGFYLEEIEKYKRKRELQKREYATHILLEALLYEIKCAKKTITKDEIEKELLRIKNRKLKKTLEKEYVENFYNMENCYEVSLYQLYGNYLQSFFGGMNLTKGREAEEIKDMGMHLFDELDCTYKR